VRVLDDRSQRGGRHAREGRVGAKIGLEILNGTYTGEKDIVVDIPIITQDTVLNFVRQDLSDSFWNNTRMPEADIQALYGGDKDGTQGF
jgi:ribose transport system substrate-binding protein